MANRMNEKTGYGVYVHGSAAPKAAPKTEPRTYVENERVTLTRAQYRNREKALHMNFSYVFMLGICSLIIFGCCVKYLSYQESIAARTANIVSLKKDITTAKSTNDALDYQINSYKDIDRITKTALEELGMVHATKDQIRFYQGSEFEYMKQFVTIK